MSPAARPGAIPDDLQLLTHPEVRAWLRISESTLARLIKAGALRGTHIGTASRIFRASVEEYIGRQAEAYAPRGSRADFGARRREVCR